MTSKKEGIVIIQYKGKDYSGFYHVEANMIKVISKYGDRTTQLHSAPPEVSARILLYQIISKKLKK